MGKYYLFDGGYGMTSFLKWGVNVDEMTEHYGIPLTGLTSAEVKNLTPEKIPEYYVPCSIKEKGDKFLWPKSVEVRLIDMLAKRAMLTDKFAGAGTWEKLMAECIVAECTSGSFFFKSDAVDYFLEQHGLKDCWKDPSSYPGLKVEEEIILQKRKYLEGIGEKPIMIVALVLWVVIMGLYTWFSWRIYNSERANMPEILKLLTLFSWWFTLCAYLPFKLPVFISKILLKLKKFPKSPYDNITEYLHRDWEYYREYKRREHGIDSSLPEDLEFFVGTTALMGLIPCLIWIACLFIEAL